MNDFNNDMLYSICTNLSAKERGKLAASASIFNQINIKIKNKNVKIVLYQWQYKTKLSKFRYIENLNQQIKEIVPISWLINTALYNDKDREKARSNIGIRTQCRFDIRTNEDNDDGYTPPVQDNSPALREITEEYTRIQYIYYPTKPIVVFLGEISNKLGQELNITHINTQIANNLLTLPILLTLMYSNSDLAIFGY